MQKIAAMSTNLAPEYVFYAPLTALVWKYVVGFRPVVLWTPGCAFGVGAVSEADAASADAAGTLALAEAAAMAHAEVIPLGSDPDVPSGILATCGRFFGGEFTGDAYWMTADIDLWPVNPGWWDRKDEGGLHLLFSDAYPDQLEFPAYGIGASGPVWREITGIPREDDPVYWLAKEYYSHRIPPDPARSSGSFDQIMMAAKIKAWNGWPDRAKLFPRGFDLSRSKGPDGYPFARGRIDRADWCVPASLDNVLDAHLPRPGFHHAFWPSVRQLFAMLLPAWADWADDYCARYVRALGWGCL